MAFVPLVLKSDNIVSLTFPGLSTLSLINKTMSLCLSTNLGRTRWRSDGRHRGGGRCRGGSGRVELRGLRRADCGLEYPVADPPVDLVALAARLVYHIVVDERVVGCRRSRRGR